MKRSSNSQISRPAPANRRRKANTKAEHQTAKIDNDRRSPASPMNGNNHHHHRGQQSPNSRSFTGSPKQCDNVIGAKLGPKTSTPSKALPPPLAISPSRLVNYAGAKFSDPPSPKMLPKPPTSWMMNKESEDIVSGDGSCSQMTSVLRVMLNVQA